MPGCDSLSAPSRCRPPQAAHPWRPDLTLRRWWGCRHSSRGSPGQNAEVERLQRELAIVCEAQAAQLDQDNLRLLHNFTEVRTSCTCDAAGLQVGSLPALGVYAPQQGCTWPAALQTPPQSLVWADLSCSGEHVLLMQTGMMCKAAAGSCCRSNPQLLGGVHATMLVRSRHDLSSLRQGAAWLRRRRSSCRAR